jgi:hypothetical protein
MLDLALGGPEDTRELAAWWVEHNGLYDWRDTTSRSTLGPSGLAGAEMKWSSGILTSGEGSRRRDVRARRSQLVVNDGKLRQRARLVGLDRADLRDSNGDVRLTSLEWTSAKAVGETHKNLNADGGPLKLAGAIQPDGIGTHADSEIVYRIPDRRRASMRSRRSTTAAPRSGRASRRRIPGLARKRRDRIGGRRSSARSRTFGGGRPRRGSEDDGADRREGSRSFVSLRAERLTPPATDAVAAPLSPNPDPPSARSRAGASSDRGSRLPLQPAAVLDLAGVPRAERRSSSATPRAARPATPSSAAAATSGRISRRSPRSTASRRSSTRS